MLIDNQHTAKLPRNVPKCVAIIKNVAKCSKCVYITKLFNNALKFSKML